MPPDSQLEEIELENPGEEPEKCQEKYRTPAEFMDCIRMPSITESIDGGVCGLIVWRAYPRMVTTEGKITNRAFEWLEAGFANDAYIGKRRSHCDKPSEGGRLLAGRTHWKGYCPVDPETGDF